jgi:YVTN family beta-propeller protein
MARRAWPIALLLVSAACAHAPALAGKDERPPPAAAAPAPQPAAPRAEPAPTVSTPEPEARPAGPVRTLDLRPVKTFPGAVAPKSVVLSPDGRWAAVMNLEGMEAWLIDTASLEIVRHIDFAPFKERAQGWDYSKKKPIDSFAQKPVEATFSNDGRYLWMSLHNGASVVVYDLEERDVVADKAPSYRAMIRDAAGSQHVWRLPRIPTGKTPKVVEISRDSRYVVVANWHSGSITVIDTAKLAPVATVQSGASPQFIPRGLAISPDSRTAYVANMGGGTISTIDLSTFKKVREDAITPNPRHLVLSRDGRILYISENAGGAVLKYDVVDQKVVARSTVGAMARTIALSHDERVLYAVSNEDGKIVALRADDLSHLYDAPFVAPMGVAISPDDRRIWVTSYTGAGYVTVFDVVIDGGEPVPQAAVVPAS